MKLKSLTLSFDHQASGFDDAELQAFQRGKDILELRDHFFVHEGVPRWALMIAYRDEGPGAAREGKGHRDWRLEIATEDRPLFDAVRAWRNERRLRDGAPAYVLLTNRQIAELCRIRPEDPAELRTVPGIGEAKAKRFGEELLAVIAATPPAGRGTEAAVEESTAEGSHG